MTWLTERACWAMAEAIIFTAVVAAFAMACGYIVAKAIGEGD